MMSLRKPLILYQIQVGFAQSAALTKLASRNVFGQHRLFPFEVSFAVMFSSHVGAFPREGYPQSLPGDAKMRLSGGRCAQIRFLIDFVPI